jgi:hypothetical protein
MKKILLIIGVLVQLVANADNPRFTVNLNGIWEFEQTDKAYVPDEFTRKIQVPGLIDLASPEIDDYDEIFMGDQDAKYSWYKTSFTVPEGQKGKKAILTLLKSRFNTQVLLNGIDLGTYIQNSTPIECDLTKYLNYDNENVLLVRVDDISRNSIQSAFSMDIEQFTYISGIWDDVFITFTGPVRIARSLLLPNAKEGKATAKIMLQNHDDKIKYEFSLLKYPAEVSVEIREKKSGKVVSSEIHQETEVTCLSKTELSLEIPISDIHLWTPDDPFLYEAFIKVYSNDVLSDEITETFGMRDFGSIANKFILNGDEVALLGSNITLSRFFNDPERKALPWDREWVKKLLIDIPKSLQWNAFRFSIGIVPDFWYDLADEYGIMIQNEWPMWKNRGWDKQIEAEFTDWVWNDGSHPSIIIWDALNESRQDYIGNVVIPELKKLDPTRIWDAGYMDSDDMTLNEMDEPHYYPLIFTQKGNEQEMKQRRLNYRWGQLFYEDRFLDALKYTNVPQVINEYAWMWINRDGTPAFITKGRTDSDEKLPQKHYYRPLNVWKGEGEPIVGLFEYFMGTDADANDRFEFQAYYIQLQTETLRARKEIAGVMSFAYLTFNKGYTGDWFLNPIKDLKPSPTLQWQYHCFAPFAVFLDMEDGRYLKNPIYHKPGEELILKLMGVNDLSTTQKGSLTFKILDSNMKVSSQEESFFINVAAHDKKFIAAKIHCPDTPGGYLLISELTDENGKTQISRRYIRVGTVDDSMQFPEMKIEIPVN